MERKSKSASSVALRLLSLREHSTAELTRKLMQRGFSSCEIAAVCSKFVERGYLDDVRVAKMCLARSIIERKNGPRRFRDELLRRGLDSELVSLTVNEYCDEIDERVIALEWVQHLAAKGENADYMKRFLYRKGFSSDVIISAVEKGQS